MNDIRRRLLATVLTMAITMPSAGCASGHAVADKPVKAPAETRKAKVACKKSKITNVASDSGSALKIYNVVYTGEGGSLSFIVPSRVSAKYSELKSDGPIDFSNSLYSRVLADGAFVYGRPFIHIWMSNNTDDPVIISNLRAVNTRTVCMPTGMLAALGSQGGDTAQLAMNFDAARPIALIPSRKGTIPQKSYFATRGAITLAPADAYPTHILIDGFLAQKARTFDLAVTYTTNDREFTQVIRPDDGGTFRVAPNICPHQEDLSLLTDEDIARFREYRFTEVLRQSDIQDHSGSIKGEVVSHDDYMKSCTTL